MKASGEALNGHRAEPRNDAPDSNAKVSVPPAILDPSVAAVDGATCVLPCVESYSLGDGYLSFEEVKRLAGTHNVPSDTVGIFYNDLNGAISLLGLLQRSSKTKSDVRGRNKKIDTLNILSARLLEQLYDWDDIQIGCSMSGHKRLAVEDSDIHELEAILNKLKQATEPGDRGKAAKGRRNTSAANVRFVGRLIEIFCDRSAKKPTAWQGRDGLYVGTLLEFVSDVYQLLKTGQKNLTIGRAIDSAKKRPLIREKLVRRLAC